MSDENEKTYKYAWQPWWQDPTWMPEIAYVRSDEPPQIHSKLLDIRASVGGLKAEKKANGPNFATKSAADLMSKLRTALDKAGCHVMVVKQTVITPDLDKIPPDGKGRVFRSFATVTTRVRICAPDGSFVEAEGTGGGGDADDKAAGKASTYSYKDALIKALTLPDADKVIDTDDESGHGATPALSINGAALVQSIAEAGTKDALRGYQAQAKELPLHERVAIKEAIQARLAKGDLE